MSRYNLTCPFQLTINFNAQRFMQTSENHSSKVTRKILFFT